MNTNKENTIKSGDNFVLIIYHYQSLTIVLLNNNNVVTKLCGWNGIRKPDVLYINHYRLNYHKANRYDDMYVFQYNISMALHGVSQLSRI